MAVLSAVHWSERTIDIKRKLLSRIKLGCFEKTIKKGCRRLCARVQKADEVTRWSRILSLCRQHPPRRRLVRSKNHEKHQFYQRDFICQMEWMASQKQVRLWRFLTSYAGGRSQDDRFLWSSLLVRYLLHFYAQRLRCNLGWQSLCTVLHTILGLCSGSFSRLWC